MQDDISVHLTGESIPYGRFEGSWPQLELSLVVDSRRPGSGHPRHRQVEVVLPEDLGQSEIYLNKLIREAQGALKFIGEIRELRAARESSE